MRPFTPTELNVDDGDLMGGVMMEFFCVSAVVKGVSVRDRMDRGFSRDDSG